MNQSKLEQKLLKDLYLNNPNRPLEYTFSEIYSFFDFQEYTEEEILAIVNNLVERKFIIYKREMYSLSRDTFLKLKDKYKFSVLLNSEYGKLIVPLMVSIVVTITSLIPNLSELFTSKSSDKEKMEIQIKELKKQLEFSINETNLIIDSLNVNKTTLIEIEVQQLKIENKKILQNINALNSLLEENPKKFVEIANLKRDIEDIKKEQNSNNESLQREVDRISSYNNTLIAFMITFLVAYIGLGVFNLVRKNESIR
ncbi:DUF5457 domain-containing protein [Myroides profundi]|uniref:Uncharacterized protein n=1 Tax=Myroides profundi TaxID=480520 RepID=A0AAJ4W4I8_MYRPR|nr:DUF5457 domain-containing protein [Myroides profundi]AJH14501.1 hypothetical protein MPR_1319 [Myroides profundi]SEQ94634.1 hypothetical protein SAMN04488089_107189 [Myroides profundi]